jgi:type IV pilus assembly protein PilM
VSDGEVVNRDGLADALKTFAAEAGLPKSVRLGVANQQIVVRVVELPRIEDEKQRDAAVRFQAAEAIAMPLDEAVLDHQVAGYTEAPDGTPRMQVVLVAARRKMIETLLEAIKAAGLKAEGVDLDAFALVRALATDGDEEDQGARVFCHLGGVTNLAVAVGSSCFFTRPLSAVWDEEDAGSRLADEIRLSIDYYMTQPQAKPVGEVVLAGPGSANDQLVEDLGIHLGMPVQVPAPLGAIDGSVLGPNDDPHRYTVAAGLSLGAAA